MTATVSGDGVVEVSLDGGPVSAVLTARAPGADPYDYTTRARFAAGGVRDVRLGLRGPLRLAHVGFSG